MSIQGPDRPDLLRIETLADILEATAARHPDALALRDATTALSYAELNAAADRVAHHLLAAGAVAGSLVWPVAPARRCCAVQPPTDPQPSLAPGLLWKHATKRWAWD